MLILARNEPQGANVSKGGIRPNAGRRPVHYLLKLRVGAGIASKLDWIAEQRRLRGQARSGWARHMLNATHAAEARTRTELGLAAGALGPEARPLIAQARKAAYDVALRTAPQRQRARVQSRVYDKRLTGWIINRVAREHGITARTAREYYGWWRKLHRMLADEADDISLRLVGGYFRGDPDDVEARFDAAAKLDRA